jgi:hypothetical protein
MFRSDSVLLIAFGLMTAGAAGVALSGSIWLRVAGGLLACLGFTIFFLACQVGIYQTVHVWSRSISSFFRQR